MSLATNLVPGDTNDATDTFVHDRLTGATERVSVDSHGRQGNGNSGLIGVAGYPSISADGRFVAFTSDATNLVNGDRNGTTDVFVRDRLAGTTTRVSVNSAGVESDGFNEGPTISADGRFVAFHSDAFNLVPKSNDFQFINQIFVHDRLTRQQRALGDHRSQGHGYAACRGFIRLRHPHPGDLQPQRQR